MSEKSIWAASVLEKVKAKVEGERQRLEGGIPYIPENGRYVDMAARDVSWWTNGFWGGILWQVGQATDSHPMKESAKDLEERFDESFATFKDIHHDVGFMWLHTAVAHYRQTGNQPSYQRGLHAATILAGRFNLAGQFIRCWNEDKTGWVIIDSMMNIPLLYWASEETEDPRFKQVALAHAETVAQHLVRQDGSVNHIAVFDPETGDFLHALGGQGYADDSAWSRGQGWAVYGFALSYKYSRLPEHLAVAKKVAHYVMGHLQETDYLAQADYRAPETPVIYDSSASLITACGLLEIAQWVPERERAYYRETAYRILQAMEALADWDPQTDGIIPKGTVQYHGVEGRHVPIIYSDYFFIEGILRLAGKSLDMW